MPSIDAPPPAPVPLPGARAARDPARALKRGPSRLPPEVVAANQRERLFDALVRTVADKGYANARVSDICQAAGVTRPAFYALFDGKQEAFLDAYRYGIGVLMHMMDAAYHDSPDWRSGVKSGLRVLLDVLASVPAFARMAIVEIEALGPTARAEREALLASFHQFFADAPGRARLVAPVDLVTAIVGGVYAMVYQKVASGRVTELPQLLPALAYFVLVPFLGREEAGHELDGLLHPADEAATTPHAS